MHFKKAHETLVYNNKIHNKLNNDNARDKIFRGEVTRKEYDNEEASKILMLLKALNK